MEKGVLEIWRLTVRKVKNELNEEILLALLRLEIFLFLEFSRKSWMTAREIVPRDSICFFAAKSMKMRMSLSYAAMLLGESLLSEESCWRNISRRGRELLCRFEISIGLQPAERETGAPVQRPGAPAVTIMLHRFLHAIELTEFAACFRLLAAFFDTRFFIVFATLQFSFDSVYLKLFFQLPDGELEVTPDFNFYHLNLRFEYSSVK